MIQLFLDENEYSLNYTFPSDTFERLEVYYAFYVHRNISINTRVLCTAFFLYLPHIRFLVSQTTIELFRFINLIRIDIETAFAKLSFAIYIFKFNCGNKLIPKVCNSS